MINLTKKVVLPIMLLMLASSSFFYGDVVAEDLNGQCPEIITTFFSDTDTKLSDGASAVATYDEHPFWTASIPGATWIWSSYYVEDPLVVDTRTFVKTFDISNTQSIVNASITLSADNTYKLFANGTLVAEDLTETNYYTEKTFDLKTYLKTGANTLNFEITNITNPLAQTKESNPAGLIYRVDVVTKENNCSQNPTNTPPTINLVGANPFNINTNVVFIDPGATANDLEDGNITQNIIKTGTVNISIPGTYTVAYSVTDSGGLSASTTRQVVVSDPYTPPVVNECTLDFYSEASDQVVGGGMAYATYKDHPDWTVNIPGATWIWSSYLVQDSTIDDTKTFEKIFRIASTSTIKSATLTVAADNSYTVSVNGIQIGADATEFNYREESKDAYNVTSHINRDQNRLSFTVKNWGVASSTPQTNPAGLLYKLAVTVSGVGENCEGQQPVNTPPVITLIGSNPMNIIVGNNFTDPGATALDREDGNITQNIIKTGTVNTSVVGTYTINYSVTDSGGLSDTKSRTVVVSPQGGGSNNPTVSLSANPNTIIAGATSNLSWNSSNTTSCSAPWTNATSTAGSQIVTPATTTQYSITCLGEGGSATATTTISVTTQSGGGPMCTLEIVSDNKTVIEGGSNAVATYKDHPYWSANIPGATWIWKTFLAQTPTQSETHSFERTFNINHAIKDATLVVAADNSYVLYVNDLKVGEDADEFNYRDEQKDTYDLKNILHSGVNTIKITVTNIGVQDASAQTNPAGLLYKLTVTENGENCDGNVPTPTLELNANPSTILNGATTTLSWSSSNVNFCTSPWTNATSTSGTQVVSPATTTSYSMSCGGNFGTTTATTTVTVNTNNGGGSNNPSVSLSANPQTINIGATSTLTWTSNNTNSCSALWTSATSTSGTQIVSPATTTEYAITCTGSNGSRTASTTVTVVPANVPVPAVSITANPSTITAGGSSTLSWTSINTNSCSATWTTATSTAGSQEVSPTASTEYAINCVGNNGSVSATTTITVNPAGGGGGGGGGGGDGGGSLSGGRRRDISNLLAPQGEVLGATSCAYLRDYLKIGWNNDPIEMLKLKSFLNVFEKENLSLTTVFDRPTFDAVSRFQNKYFDDILEPWGHKAPTGFVYILTKKKINEIYCNTEIILNQADKEEIAAFKALMDSYDILASSQGYREGNSAVSANQLQAVLSEVLAESESGIVVVELKDKATTSTSTTGSVLKNAAVSIFALPKLVMSNLEYVAILIVAIVGAFIITRELAGKSAETVGVQSPVDESPVIILPGKPKTQEGFSNTSDAEEIVIDGEEDVEGEIKIKN